MKKTIIHLSDLHFRTDWEEEQGLVLEAFFKDLYKQIQLLDKSKVYLIFSGDIVLAGGDSKLYDAFLKQFDDELNKLNIPRSQRICIPGNHDISVDFIKDKSVEHEGVVTQKLNETDFNNYLSKQPTILTDKFPNYKSFETKFADYGISNNILSGAGWDLDENIGLYCLNTAICSSGGYNAITDKERLAVDTRSLQKWILESKSKTKILVMHHPKEWLRDWAQTEITKILRKDFSLCLSGHIHDQSVFHSINKDFPLVECSAPPLLTNKKGKLGYSLITVSAEGVMSIQYRQWTKNHSFVTGVDFSDNDDGRIIVKKDAHFKKDASIDIISHILNRNLDDALCAFSSQPIVWVEPVLSNTNEISQNADDNFEKRIVLSDFISNPKSTIIVSPPQFGLTCLAFYLAKEAWRIYSSFWLYLDTKKINSNLVEKAVKKELLLYGVELSNVKCIVLDSWSNYNKDSIKILNSLTDLYKELPIIVMQTIDDSKFQTEPNNDIIQHQFDVLHLLALPRGQIRKVVSAYNKVKNIGDDDIILTKIISDLEVLNIHRTPYNCLTLLKVAEKYFDESPVNRTKMLEMVLFILFDMDGVPTYKTKPDLKDCEYVLGRFCEKMIKSNSYYFSREDFSKELKSFCTEKLIALEVDVVFDVLHSNNIIIKYENQYLFRSTYWIYYFAAQRMHSDQEFANYIFEEKRYISFPEIIEFYTGIDRNRGDALKILVKDLRETCDIVKNKVGLPDDMNPYRTARWKPTEENIGKMQSEISGDVLKSKLPDSVKDQYADTAYNQIRPYNQNIQTILSEYSLVILIQKIRACSRALRNSDYVEPEIKKEMLNEIMRSWEQLAKVLLALSPMLATKGQAAFEGAGFVLCGDFGNTFEERINRIIQATPTNVVAMFKNDLFSSKMGPLLFDQMANETNELKKHKLVLLLIYERPFGWKRHVESYIVAISKNSFYLYNIYNVLRAQYRFSYASPSELNDIKYLIKMGLAKHELGIMKPKHDKILKISDSVIPIREIDDGLNS